MYKAELVESEVYGYIVNNGLK